MLSKRKWHLWLISIFMIFMYSMGIYDFFMMLSHNASYYASHGFGEAAMNYFTDYPIYFMIFWITNLLCGFLAPILLLMRKRSAINIALTSAIVDIIFIALTSIFKNRIEVLGLNIFLFDIFIVLITFGFYFYCKSIYEETFNS